MDQITHPHKEYVFLSKTSPYDEVEKSFNALYMRTILPHQVKTQYLQI